MICYLGGTENNEKAEILIASRKSGIECLLRDRNADLKLTCKPKKYFNTLQVTPKNVLVYTQ